MKFNFFICIVSKYPSMGSSSPPTVTFPNEGSFIRDLEDIRRREVKLPLDNSLN